MPISSADLVRKYSIETRKDFLVGFGTDQLTPNQLPWAHHLLRQVHGKTIVEAQQGQPEADGQWTELTNHALVIKTADCLPVFFKSRERIVALHIGWRGLRHRILSEAVASLNVASLDEIFIGPHIQQKSFELDLKSAKSLLDSHNIHWGAAISKRWIVPSIHQQNHVHVALSEILRNEATQLGFKSVLISSINTFTSPFHFSYRRQKMNTGRNFSFIVKTI